MTKTKKQQLMNAIMPTSYILKGYDVSFIRKNEWVKLIDREIGEVLELSIKQLTDILADRVHRKEHGIVGEEEVEISDESIQLAKEMMKTASDGRIAKFMHGLIPNKGVSVETEISDHLNWLNIIIANLEHEKQRLSSLDQEEVRNRIITAMRASSSDTITRLEEQHAEVTALLDQLTGQTTQKEEETDVDSVENKLKQQKSKVLQVENKVGEAREKLDQLEEELTSQMIILDQLQEQYQSLLPQGTPS